MSNEAESNLMVTEHEVYVETNRLAVSASAAIERAMEAALLKRSDVAAAIGVAKSRVTKVLDGDANITLRTLAQLGLACGVRWQIVGVKADDPCVVVTAPDTLLESLASPYVYVHQRTFTFEVPADLGYHPRANEYSLAA